MNRLAIAKEHITTNDSTLGLIITATTELPPFVAHTNYYQSLVDSIISQQLSVKAAHAIETRFKALFNNTFPTPEQIMTSDDELLRSAGLSRPKVRYIKDLAKHIVDGEVQFDTLDVLSNGEIIQELTRVKGIGEWTVHMFLMFCMGRLDVLPVGDLGIRNGVQKLYALSHLPSPNEVQEIALKNRWHPYESVASWYIWHSLDNEPKIAN